MSRCFPYPPPGYVRIPVAVAEVETTTKLQKEREKAEKKKEKRNDKKALQQGGGEASKHSKRSHKKRKHEDISIAGQECRKASKEPVEQLEKSGLSEEYGAPCFIQTVHGSPESSQDSSKRRKVVLPSPSQNKNGNILRIKIRRDQDSPAATLDNSRVLEQPPVHQMGSGSSLLSNRNLIQPHNSKVMVKSAAALPQSIKIDSQPVLNQVNVEPPAKVLQRVAPPRMSKVMQKVDPLTTGKVMQKIDPRLSFNAAKGRLDPPSAKVMGSADPPPAKLTRRVVPPPAKAAQRIDVPPAKVSQRVVDPLPSKVLLRDDPPASAMVLQKETSPIAFRQPDGQQPLLLQKSKVPVDAPAIKQQQANSLPKEEPCFSGRNTEAAAVPEVVKQSKSDRKKSRKAEKKERKFGDLFVTWNPPSFEIEDTGDLGEQDWLLGGARKHDASMIDCTASDGLVPFHSREQQFSLQPRAIHLPDLHVYQLPYVVPF